MMYKESRSCICLSYMNPSLHLINMQQVCGGCILCQVSLFEYSCIARSYGAFMSKLTPISTAGILHIHQIIMTVLEVNQQNATQRPESSLIWHWVFYETCHNSDLDTSKLLSRTASRGLEEMMDSTSNCETKWVTKKIIIRSV